MKGGRGKIIVGRGQNMKARTSIKKGVHAHAQRIYQKRRIAYTDGGISMRGVDITAGLGRKQRRKSWGTKEDAAKVAIRISRKNWGKSTRKKVLRRDEGDREEGSNPRTK